MPVFSLTKFPIGSYGQSIRATVVERDATTGELEAVDISTATSLKIILITPVGDGSRRIEKTATLINSGTDGKMGYTVESGFFASNNPGLIGTWRYKPTFTLGTYVGGANEWASFRVVD